MSKEVKFQGQTVIELSNGDAVLRVAPDHGARLLNWEIGGVPLIYWPDDADWSQVALVRGGNPILFPFIARHYVDGEIGKWRDDTGTVRDMPMHGFARDSKFTFVDDDESKARMRLVDTEESRAYYPFSFIFDVVYELHEKELRVVFETINKGDKKMPYYAGHHFYFPVPHDTRDQWEVELPAVKWATQNSDGSMNFNDASENILQLSDASIIDRMQVQEGIEGFRNVELRRKDGSYKLFFDLQSEGFPWYAVTTWTQTEKSDFFCVEPWLGLPNAIHHGHGLRWLEPGQKETAGFTFKWQV